MRAKKRRGDLSFAYEMLAKELKNNNRFFLPAQLKKTADEYVEYHIAHHSKNISSGTKYARARVNQVGQYKPFPRKEMGAPPAHLVGAGRVNPEGISYLYLADKAETAMAEVRPHKGAAVSVAAFDLKKDIKVVSLQRGWGNVNFADLENDLRGVIKGYLHSSYINPLYFSSPVHADDKLAYLPSQYLSELIKLHGIDGIEYPSAMSNGGINLVLFNPSIAQCGAVKQFYVRGVTYDFSEEDESARGPWSEGPSILDLSNVTDLGR